jgi:plasmid stabilization system protein ParE
MGWKVIISPSAQADLADVVRYVAKHNSGAAARLGFEFLAAYQALPVLDTSGMLNPGPTSGCIISFRHRSSGGSSACETLNASAHPKASLLPMKHPIPG